MRSMGLEEISQGIASAAGWQSASPDAAGVCRYFLEENLDLEIQVPDGRVCILTAGLGSLPQDPAEADDRIERVCRLAAASFRSRRSIASIHDGRIELHLAFVPDTLEAAVARTRDFLNDEAWWKEALDGQVQPSSPFAFSGSFGEGFPGQFGFGGFQP